MPLNKLQFNFTLNDEDSSSNKLAMVKERVIFASTYKGIGSRSGVFYVALSYPPCLAVIILCGRRK